MKTKIKPKVISDPKDFKNIFTFFSSFVDSDLTNIICDIIKNGGTVEVSSDIKPEKGLWDGLITINFPYKPSAQEIVTLIKEANSPSDFGMNNDKSLYLWWDG